MATKKEDAPEHSERSHMAFYTAEAVRTRDPFSKNWGEGSVEDREDVHPQASAPSAAHRSAAVLVLRIFSRKVQERCRCPRRSAGDAASGPTKLKTRRAAGMVK